MKYIPVADKIIVRPLTDAEQAVQSASGIFIPETAKQDNEAIVVAIGEGVFDARLEKHIPVSVEVGDRIVHSGLHGWKEPIKYEGIECYVINESHILAYAERS